MKRAFFGAALIGLFLFTACSRTSVKNPQNTPADTPPSVTDDEQRLPESMLDGQKLPESTLRQDEGGNYEGDIYVRGYAEKKMMDEPFCTENCTRYEYVFFRVTESGSPVLEKFLQESSGNAYLTDDSIGLGCLENGIIVRRTFESDGQRGETEYRVDEDTAAEILASTPEAPIVLKLEKEKLIGGGAPACFGHFMDYEVVNS